jgi:crossover junction endodeoxyribonuclease RuvC
MRILGIDPGLRVTGYGVIEAAGNRLSYVASGVVRVPNTGSLPPRLKTILDGVGEVIAAYQPQQAVIEIVFVNANPQSTLLLGQARGAAICALVAADIPVAEFTALQIKQAVTGAGKAAKTQVQAMVMRLLNLPAPPSADAADALAAAITFANLRGAMGGLATRGYKVRGGRLVKP